MSEVFVTYLPQYSPIIEIINDELETKYESGSRNKFTVNPGVYLVRGRLPSGEMVSATTMVGEGEIRKVYLKFSTPSHSGLRMHHSLGRSIKPLEGKVPWFPEIWLRLWEGPGDWHVADVKDWHSEHYYGKKLATYHYYIKLNQFRKKLYLIQLGGPKVPWRFISVPNIGGTMLRLWPTDTPTDLNGGILANITNKYKKLDYILEYVNSGAIESAKLFFQERFDDDYFEDQFAFENYDKLEILEDHAEALFSGKVDHPLPAAIAGYFLLRIGALERLHNWPNNFVKWVKFLPDAPVIHAWQLLRQPRPSGKVLKLARLRLLEAVERGLPVYTEGLRLLIDGLEMFADEARRVTGDGGSLQLFAKIFAKKKGDREVENALKMVRTYAEAMDWSQPLTTYYGAHPNEPSLQPVTGTPKEISGLLFLEGVEEKTS